MLILNQLHIFLSMTYWTPCMYLCRVSIFNSLFPSTFSESVETYSFVLTSEDSKWRFGFCRHDPKTETAMIIITYLPWHDTFLKLMGVLVTLRRTDNSNFQTFLSEAYNRGVPDLGGTLNIFYNGGQNV